jgi:RNA polymerase sigma-70 factor (sigma-E family)
MWTLREPRSVGDDLHRAYDAHHLALLRLAVLLTGADAIAEDLVHDVFVRSRDRLGRLPHDEARAYLRRALVNAWRNEIRHRGVERRYGASLRPRAVDDPSDAIASRDELWNAIERLPERQRAIVVLRYYEDLPDAEIARLLGCARVTVRTQAKRALAKLEGEMTR